MRRATAGLAGLAAAAALAVPAHDVRAQTAFNLGGESFGAAVTSLRDMPFRAVVRQQYDYSCGSAALATLLSHHYDHRVGEAEIFKAMYAVGDQAKISKVGFSLLDMKTYLRTIGFASDGYRRTLADLERLERPAIALIRLADYRHFVVIKGVRGGKVLVGDPAQGLKAYDLQTFGRMWDGAIFVVHPRGEGVKYNNPREWAALQPGPFNGLDDTALASLTRDLPPFHQILAFSDGSGVVR